MVMHFLRPCTQKSVCVTGEKLTKRGGDLSTVVFHKTWAQLSGDCFEEDESILHNYWQNVIFVTSAKSFGTCLLCHVPSAK